MKHTPGPWDLRGSQIRAEGGLGRHVGTYTSNRADGRLMAAAPDLLKTLEEITATLDVVLGSKALPQSVRPGLEAMHKVCTAALWEAKPTTEDEVLG